MQLHAHVYRRRVIRIPIYNRIQVSAAAAAGPEEIEIDGRFREIAAGTLSSSRVLFAAAAGRAMSRSRPPVFATERR